MTALIKGLPGNGTYSRYAPCGAITRPMLLHHSVGHDLEYARAMSPEKRKAFLEILREANGDRGEEERTQIR